MIDACHSEPSEEPHSLQDEGLNNHRRGRLRGVTVGALFFSILARHHNNLGFYLSIESLFLTQLHPSGFEF